MVNILSFSRLTAKFLAVSWLTVNPIETLFNLLRHFAYAWLSPSLPLCQSFNLAWACEPIKNLVPDQQSTMSSRPEPIIWSCHTGQRIPCFGSCQLIMTWMSVIKDVPMVMVLLLFFKLWGLANGRTNVTTVTWQTKFLKSMGYHFSKVWGSACMPSARWSSLLLITEVYHLDLGDMLLLIIIICIVQMINRWSQYTLQWRRWCNTMCGGTT